MKIKSKTTDQIYDVLFSNQDGYLVKADDGSMETFWTTKISNFKEYKEPRKMVGYAHIWDNGKGLYFGGIVSTPEDLKKSTTICMYPSVGTVKIEWVEGE